MWSLICVENELYEFHSEREWETLVWKVKIVLSYIEQCFLWTAAVNYCYTILIVWKCTGKSATETR